MDLPNLFLSKYKSDKSDKSDKFTPQQSLSKFQQPIHPTAPIIGDLGEYQCDLAFMDDYAKFNEGYKIILTLIHIQSRFLYSYLLKTKGQSTNKLIDIIPTLEIPMTRIRLDARSEFTNKKLTSFFANNNIEITLI